jgi:hypothetical protein
MNEKLEPGKEIEIPGFIVSSEYGFITWSESDMSAHDYSVVMRHTLKFTVPAEFNPVAAEVAALEKKLEKTTEDHMQTVRRIKGRIQELLCIENNPSAA